MRRALTRRQRVAAIVLAALAACFITLDATGSGLESAHGGIRGTLGSLYRGTDAVLGPVRRFVQGVPAAGSNAQEVRDLQRQNAELRKRVADSAVDRVTARELDRLRLAAADPGQRVVPARVLAMNASQGFDYTATVDAGTTSGVRAGQSVTDGVALVGRVVHADADSAVVLLAVDPGSGVGARDLDSGQLGVATGAGEHGFSYRPLDPADHPAVGDRLTTGPAGSSSYVSGLAIGTVASVRVSGDGTTIATVTPAVSASGLDLVGVVLLARHARARPAVGG